MHPASGLKRNCEWKLGCGFVHLIAPCWIRPIEEVVLRCASRASRGQLGHRTAATTSVLSTSPANRPAAMRIQVTAGPAELGLEGTGGGPT
jgi:hypothetical protein